MSHTKSRNPYAKLAALVGGALVIGTVGTAAAQVCQVNEWTDTRLSNAATGRCMTFSGEQVVINTACSARNPNQRWNLEPSITRLEPGPTAPTAVVYQIKFAGAEQSCLTTGSSTSPELNIETCEVDVPATYPREQVRVQLWTLTPSGNGYTLCQAFGNRCLTAVASNNISLEPSSGTIAQRWTMSERPTTTSVGSR